MSTVIDGYQEGMIHKICLLGNTVKLTYFTQDNQCEINFSQIVGNFIFLPLKFFTNVFIFTECKLPQMEKKASWFLLQKIMVKTFTS